MSNYYAEKLNSQSLFNVYETKIPRVKQYLEAEIDYVRKRLTGRENILELDTGMEDIKKILGLLAPGGTAYFSSYSSKLWEWRLKWFEEQAGKGLLGEIDYDKTKDGVIICKDGFRAITHSPEDLREIGEDSRYPYVIDETDESSVFLIITKPGKNGQVHIHIQNR